MTAKSQTNKANILRKEGTEWKLTPEFAEFNKNVRYADYGSERRKNLLVLLEKGLEFPINVKHCPQLDTDTDIKKLLKDGKIELFNVREWNSHHKCTHVRIRR